MAEQCTPATPTRYGAELLGGLIPSGERWLLATTPAPWEIARAQFSRQPPLLHMVTTMAEEAVEAATAALPALDGVLGIGGGSCMDFAKYVAWRKGIPCILAPSIVSVDACLTDAAAVRREGRVHYIGHAVPREVVVDFDLICKALAHEAANPVNLNALAALLPTEGNNAPARP